MAVISTTGVNLQRTEDTTKQIAQHTAQVKMHEGEIDIDVTLVRRLLSDQFPTLAERSISAVQSTGTFNAILRLGDDLYVRLPRLRAWEKSLDREWNWLTKLAPHISLHIPEPLARGTMAIIPQ